ncbi:MAG: hypothetical protein U9N44_06350 [Chloroflexota bacterium]|nr:hypothetical protein [Chloroflexota bacterium]
MDEGFIKHLMTAVSCNVCGNLYEDDDVEVLGRYNDLWFLSVCCSVCESEGLVAAILKSGSPAEIITDFTTEEYGRFRGIDAVDVDDLLGVHDFLKEFDGDFGGLFDMGEVDGSSDFY